MHPALAPAPRAASQEPSAPLSSPDGKGVGREYGSRGELLAGGPGASAGAPSRAPLRALRGALGRECAEPGRGGG